MHDKTSDELIDEIIDMFDKHFKDRVAGGYTILEYTDTPYITFSMRFELYDYFNIIFNYDRGSFGCAIINGEVGISLKNSQKWYDKADMDIFFKELEQQIELRIPDKFLEFHGWK